MRPDVLGADLQRVLAQKLLVRCGLVLEGGRLLHLRHLATGGRRQADLQRRRLHLDLLGVGHLRRRLVLRLVLLAARHRRLTLRLDLGDGVVLGDGDGRHHLAVGALGDRTGRVAAGHRARVGDAHVDARLRLLERLLEAAVARQDGGEAEDLRHVRVGVVADGEVEGGEDEDEESEDEEDEAAAELHVAEVVGDEPEDEAADGEGEDGAAVDEQQRRLVVGGAAEADRGEAHDEEREDRHLATWAAGQGSRLHAASKLQAPANDVAERAAAPTHLCSRPATSCPGRRCRRAR